MGIKIKQVRIHGLRGLENLQVDLENTTVLMGMNNAGKTTFLKALQIALGSTQFITKEDFNFSNGKYKSSIIVDVKIIPTNKDDVQLPEFDDEWELLFKEDRIRYADGNAIVPFRTIVSYDPITANYKTKQYPLDEWPTFIGESDTHWFNSDVSSEKNYRFEEIPFFYVDAQRDIIEDLRLRSSFLGRMISKVEYSETDLKSIEKQIKELNEKAVDSSTILSTIRENLKELDSAMDSKSESVEITPFAKKVRDLNKSVSIAYGQKEETFPMEYHGMGTRSWSSLLTLKSFIKLRHKLAEEEHTPFFPIITIEEPESHLHPNAQKKIFGQIIEMEGQKVISTHSPFVVSCAELSTLRNFYKKDSVTYCGAVDTSSWDPEELRKVNRLVMNTRANMFFSKAIVLSEGETEEQALPIFAEHHFDETTYCAGIDFIGVGGYGGYLPFIKVADAFNIPWFIFSDGEKATKDKIEKDVKEIYGNEAIIDNSPNIVMFDGEANFEKYLIGANYLDEIKSAIACLNDDAEYFEKYREKTNGAFAKSVKTDKKCDKCKQFIYNGEYKDYNGIKGEKRCIFDYISKNKARIAPLIADAIIKSGKPLPDKITELFIKVRNVFRGAETNE